MDYKERLERATLMAMQGILANQPYNAKEVAESSFRFAKSTLDYIDSQFPNQETQEEQEPKRGDIVWVKDKESQVWTIAHFVKRVKEKIFVTVDDPFEDCDNYPYYDGQMITKNPYTDGN